MHEGLAPMVENIETLVIHALVLKMVNGKVVDVTLITSELLKWTMPSTRYWILTIIDQAIKQGLPNDWLVNWIKPILKARDKNQSSNYHIYNHGEFNYC